jgi:cation channel sperm-associated protein 2
MKQSPSGSNSDVEESSFYSKKSEAVSNDVVLDDLNQDFAYAFHDLSSRSCIFRNKLIEEFQLLENLSSSGGSSLPPQYNTRDVRDPTLFGKIMHEAPTQLIKFQAFKRTRQTEKIDRRFTRIRNKDKVPLGAWAAYVNISLTMTLPHVVRLLQC